MNLFESLAPAEFRRIIDAPLRRYFLGLFVSSLAMGLTLSLYVVYLHNVLHFSIGFSTLLLAVASLVGLATSPLWGTLTDHVGPVKVMVLTGVADALALVVWAYVHSATSAVIGALLLAVFGGAGWGPGSTLLGRLVTPEHRQRAYGFNFMLVNLGGGGGGLISAAVVDLHHPLTFRWLYLANAAVVLVASAIFLTLWRHGPAVARVRDERAATSARAGWGQVLADGRLVRYVLASVILMLGGFAAIDTGLSLFVVNNLHLSVHVIGVFLFVDTAVIVLAQLVVLHVIEGRSRTKVLAAVGAMWGVFWLILAASLALPAEGAVVAISGAMVIFAVGEAMLSPVGPALVNEIAPEHLRGRYNAALGLTWGFSSTLSPAIVALYFGNGLSDWWPLSVGVVALAGGALMLNLRRHLSAGEDGRAPSVNP